MFGQVGSEFNESLLILSHARFPCILPEQINFREWQFLQEAQLERETM